MDEVTTPACSEAAPAKLSLVDVLHGAKFSKATKPTLSPDGTALEIEFRQGRELYNVRITSETGFKVSRRIAKKKVKVTYDYDQVGFPTA